MAERALKKVVFVSQFPNMVGGGEYSLLDLMSHLPSAIEPILLTPSKGIFTDKAKALGIQEIHLPMPRLVDARINTFSLWKKELKSLKPDILHANNSRAAFFAGLIGKQLNIPVIFHCRISETDGLMDMLIKRLVSVVICNSHAVAERFHDFTQPVHVIYNGLSVTPKPNLINPLPSAKKYMLFIGRLTEEKQVNQALAVFAQLADNEKDLQFVIVGGKGPDDHGYVQGLQDWSDTQSWGNRVHWIGHSEEVTRWYVHAQFLILTSKHEGFGRVLVESMAQATPVIAYAVGGVPEVFEDNKHGFLIEPNDVKAMTKACTVLLTDENKRLVLGRTAQLHAQSYSIEKHVQKIVVVYDVILNGAGDG